MTWRSQIPNLLTLLRIVLIPLVALTYYFPFQYHFVVSAAIFAFAAITDGVDGYLARRWGQISAFGAFLDPVADKLMVVAALLMLVGEHSMMLGDYRLMIIIPAIIIICREILISALREWMAEVGKRASLDVSYLGKVKTTVQMVALIALLAVAPNWQNPLMWLGYALLYSAMVLTLWSMTLYITAAFRAYKKS